MFGKNLQGLTSEAASQKLEEYGQNILPEKLPPSNFLIFISQLKSPLVYVLIFAGLITIFIKDYSDAAIIGLAVLLNTVLGFFQERKAGRALYALKKFVTHYAEVVRDGKRKKIESSQIVPGDIVVLSAGSKVPADGVLININRLFVDEAMLTGENVPIGKLAGDKVFMGTIISSGQGIMEVEVTGKSTKVGKIAVEVQEEYGDTPLKRQISRFSKQLLYLTLSLTVLVFVLGLLKKQELLEIFKTAVALAVSAIPEGLIVSLTVVLAIGMQRILKRRGLVRNLSSAETLGGVTTICVDKTGTLTEGKMRVVDVIGDRDKIAMQVVLANDLDDPLVVAAYDWGKKFVNHFGEKYPRIDSLPFSPKERFFASLNRWEDKNNMIFVNGAPDFLLKWCNMSDKDRGEAKKRIDELTSQGKRVMGLARKIVDSGVTKLDSDLVKKDLEFVGIVSFLDPVRMGVTAALEEARMAGIKIIVVTGDYAETAVSVMRELGIGPKKGEILTGEELNKLEENSDKLKNIKLFARTTPEQKLKIIEFLKLNGEVVAMMGDGVNDAPALNRADIGIVVGEATDVARESSDLVLLDSNFSTIVAAVEEGRGIFENIRKIILYLLSDAFGEITTVIGAMVLGLPLPITAIQILWINIISDGFPSLSLTVDPKRRGIMNERPRGISEPVVAPWMKVLIGIVSFSSGLVALIYFYIVLTNTGDLLMARSAAFLTLGINSLVYVFSVKNLTTPFWRGSVFNNKWLTISVFAGFMLQIIPFVTESTRNFFQVKLLPLNYWFVAISLSFLMFIIVEVSKLTFRKEMAAR